MKVEATEKEREFYFEKLRDIEVLCQLPAIADLTVCADPQRIGSLGPTAGWSLVRCRASTGAPDCHASGTGSTVSCSRPVHVLPLRQTLWYKLTIGAKMTLLCRCQTVVRLM